MENLYYTILIIASLPSLWVGIKFIVKRTRTKKDDALVEKIDNEHS